MINDYEEYWLVNKNDQSLVGGPFSTIQGAKASLTQRCSDNKISYYAIDTNGEYKAYYDVPKSDIEIRIFKVTKQYIGIA